MPACTFAHTRLHVHSHTHACMYIHTHTPACTFTHTCLHVHPHTHASMYIRTHTPACTFAHTCLHVHSHTHACMYIHTHMPACTFTHLPAHTFTHTCLHVHSHTCLHVHTHTCLHVHSHTHACMYIHTLACTYIHTHMPACTFTHMPACTYTHMPACTFTHTCLHIHSHTYACMYIHTNMPACTFAHTCLHVHPPGHIHTHLCMHACMHRLKPWTSWSDTDNREVERKWVLWCRLLCQTPCDSKGCFSAPVSIYSASPQGLRMITVCKLAHHHVVIGCLATIVSEAMLATMTSFNHRAGNKHPLQPIFKSLLKHLLGQFIHWLPYSQKVNITPMTLIQYLVCRTCYSRVTVVDGERICLRSTTVTLMRDNVCSVDNMWAYQWWKDPCVW